MFIYKWGKNQCFTRRMTGTLAECFISSPAIAVAATTIAAAITAFTTVASPAAAIAVPALFCDSYYLAPFAHNTPLSP